jgi:iron(III) transport system substrate-binding protein
MWTRAGTAAVLCALVGACGGGAGDGDDDTVVVYSSRQEHLIAPLFEQYENETGVRVRFVTDSEGPLLLKLESEGDSTPADVLMTVDAGNLWAAAERGLLQPVDSPVLERNVPTYLRDPEQRWFGLSVRARTIAYNTRTVDPADLSTYEALAEPAWAGRLCLRTSRKVYNQSLVAMLIAEHGEARTEEIVAGWVENLAAPVFSSDTLVLEAIAAGQCDVGIVNSYYFGRLEVERPDIPVALFWPNQEGSGVHVNISGAGVTRHAPRPEAGLALIEWLSSPTAQAFFAAVNLEYPASESVAVDPVVAAWGEFRRNTINVSRAGELQADAVRLMDRAGYR